MENRLSQLQEEIRNLHDIVDRLNKLYPRFDPKSKKFTLDGRLVGDIGEEIAAEVYQLTLFEKQIQHYDGATPEGKRVQVKCTFKNHLTFNHLPEHYIGLKLYPDGSFEEIYNGPGKYIHECYEHRGGIGKKLLSFPIDKLAELSAKEVKKSEKIDGKINIYTTKTK